MRSLSLIPALILALISPVLLADTTVIGREHLKYQDWDGNVKTLENPILFDECSHHSPQSAVRVDRSLQGHYGVEWKTTTYYGTCTQYEVLDLETGMFWKVEPYGPDCPVGPAASLAPLGFDGETAQFDALLAELIATLALVDEGYACHQPQPQLDNTLAYLRYIAALRASSAE